MRNESKIAKDWWDYTTLDEEILDDAAKLSEKEIVQLSRPGFKIKFYETLESLYMAEAIEYISCWTRSTESKPAGICGSLNPHRC